MITEAILLGGGWYTINNLDKLSIRIKWRQIMHSRTQFTNKLDKDIKLWKIYRTIYGNILEIELPYGYTVEHLRQDIDIFSEGLGYDNILLESEGNIVYLYCVKDYIYTDYEPQKLPPNILLVGEGFKRLYLEWI